jgi:hypothetical protein
MARVKKTKKKWLEIRQQQFFFFSHGRWNRTCEPGETRKGGLAAGLEPGQVLQMVDVETE